MVILAVGACSRKEKTEATETKKTESAEPADTSKSAGAHHEPDAVVVQHILVGFRGSVPDKPIARTQEEAQKLAGELMARAKAGENFEVMVQQYTDDSAPGIYRMSNFGQPGGLEQATFPRVQMVRGFGDVAFSLEIGEVGVAEFDQEKSPYGWHVMKRLE
jgi:foldase protein PrsA